MQDATVASKRKKSHGCIMLADSGSEAVWRVRLATEEAGACTERGWPLRSSSIPPRGIGKLACKDEEIEDAVCRASGTFGWIDVRGIVGDLFESNFGEFFKLYFW